MKLRSMAEVAREAIAARDLAEVWTGRPPWTLRPNA